MLGNRPSTSEDDLYPSALVHHLGSAFSSGLAASGAVIVTDLSDSTSFESSKGRAKTTNIVLEGAFRKFVQG